jgi:hypothetical protein
VGMGSMRVACGEGDPVSGRERLRHVSHPWTHDGTRTCPAMTIGCEVPAGYLVVQNCTGAPRVPAAGGARIHWASMQSGEDTREPLSSGDMRSNEVAKADWEAHALRIRTASACGSRGGTRCGYGTRGAVNARAPWGGAAVQEEALHRCL